MRKLKRRIGKRPGAGTAWAVATACLIGGTTLGLGSGQQPSEDGTVAAAVWVEGLDLGGRTRGEVAEALEGLADRKLGLPLLLHSGTLRVRTTPSELGGRCDAPQTLAAVFDQSQSGSWLQRLGKRVGLTDPRRSVGMPVEFDPAEFGRRLRPLANRVEQPPVEPRARLEAGRLVAGPGRSGRLLDVSAILARLTGALQSEALQRQIATSISEGVSVQEWAARAQPTTLELTLRDATPRITPQHVREVDTLLASFSTSFSLRDRNRVHNIRLAARSIDGLLLLPGDEFSYNETVGPRRRRRGFRTAPEIVRGELVPGIGGGVCQVSSTLYNAALLADLEVTRRQHHRFPVSYLQAGRDATVSDGGLDLRFRNRLEAPIALLISAQGSHVRVRIYGAKHCKRTVRLLTRRLRPAYTRSGGRRVALTRVVEGESGILRRETLSRDSYEPPPGTSGTKRRSVRARRARTRVTGGAPRDTTRPALDARSESPREPSIRTAR